MTSGAYHPTRTPDGNIVRKDVRPDGRSGRRKNREIVYYVRLDDEWFDRLQSMLDVPANRAAHTAIAGCEGRADLMEKVFTVFLRIDELSRELNYRDVDDLVTHMIEAIRFLLRQTAAPQWISIEHPHAALPITSNVPQMAQSD